MALSNRTKDIVEISLADRRAAAELNAAVDAGLLSVTGVTGPTGPTGVAGQTGVGVAGTTGAASTVAGQTGVAGATGVTGVDAYTPSVAGSWTGAAPTTFTAAINRLTAQIVAGLTGPCIG